MGKQTAAKAVRVVLGLGLAAASFGTHAAGVRFEPAVPDLKVSESGIKAYYAIALTDKPAAPVAITLHNGDGQLTLQDNPGGAVLQFSPDNYDQPQAVKVGAVNDRVPEGTHHSAIGYQLASADVAYNNAAVEPTDVTVLDDDQADVVLTQSDGSTRVKEGGVQDSYTIRLGAQPSADVRISVSTDAKRLGRQLQLRLSPESLTFTPDNYATPQTVTVAAVDDDLAEGPDDSSSREHLWHEVSSEDSAYNLFPVKGDGMDFEVTIEDDDIEVAGFEVRITGEDTRVTEGGQGDSYMIVLKTRPSAPVTVSVVPDNSEVDVSPASLTFTPDNYGSPQAFNVTASDDSSAEGTEETFISHTVTTADRVYRERTVEPVRVLVYDNDVHAVLMAETQGSTSVTEGGEVDSYTLALTKRPTANVTVYIEAGDQLRAEPSLLTFNASNFATPQTVTLSAVDDDVAEDVRKEVVTHSIHSDDFAYDNAVIDDLIVTVHDNDVRAVLIEQSAGSTRVVEGSEVGDFYTVVLGARPEADVTVTVEAGDGLVADPAVLTFTPQDFNTPQAVALTAPDDGIAQGKRVSLVGHRVASGDAGYEGLAVAPLEVEVEDSERIPKSAGGKSGGGSLDLGTLMAMLLAAVTAASRAARRLHLG